LKALRLIVVARGNAAGRGLRRHPSGITRDRGQAPPKVAVRAVFARRAVL
jgi:hypothetical protein